jgi:subtilisin family serine protease
MGARLVAVAAAVAALVGAGAAGARTLPPEPLIGSEWWLSHVGADRADPPGPGIPVTIVDSGIDTTNPDFAGRPDTTMLNDQTTLGGEEEHGTAVASVIGAPENGAGLMGVYPQAKLQSFDASPSPRGIFTAPAVEGIERAAASCPGVINLSFGGRDRDPRIEHAVLDAVHNGCVVVAAAGNERRFGSPAVYPAALPHVLTVGATDQSDAVARFSTASPSLDLAAPGVGIPVAVPSTDVASGYDTLDGTSFASPIVAGAAAWIWTVRPDLDASQVFDLLRMSARDVGPPGWDSDTGFGILDIPNALTMAAPPRDPSEPNDDVGEVQPGMLFANGEPALTDQGHVTATIDARVDRADDPHDVYRVWVPAHQRLVAHVTATDGAVVVRFWRGGTHSINENAKARKRDLLGARPTAGAHGFAAYVDVAPTGPEGTVHYELTVTAATP